MPSSSFEEADIAVDLGGFEGAEKKMEIIFSKVLEDSRYESHTGLRSYGREHWSEVIALLNGSILKHEPLEAYDAYLISESSLFVYPERIVILTCGTTTLLKTLPAILESARKIDLDVCWFQYSRKNFLFPEKQLYPHTSFDQEVKFCSQIFEDGQPYVLGPMNSDHWYVFIADRMGSEESNERMNCEQTLNIYMYGINQDVAQFFVKAESMIIPSIFEASDAKDKSEPSILKASLSNLSTSSTFVNLPTSFVTCAAEATMMSGIGGLLTEDNGQVVHDHLFEPCGYSMNGLAAKDRYWTIHITPEAHCSYVSFETNLETSSYSELISKVVGTFQPQRFTTVLQTDGNSRLARSLANGISGLSAPGMKGYNVSGRSLTQIGGQHAIQLVNYDAIDQPFDEGVCTCSSSSGSQLSFE